MLKKICLGIVVSSLLWAETTMNNDTVIQLVKAGINDEVVVNAIAYQPGSYRVGPTDLIALQRVGVSKTVIGAMLRRTQNSALPTNESALPSGDVLRDGTAVRLRLSRTLSSAQITTGETIDFEVLEEVRSGDLVIIPRAAKAIGTVTEAEHKKRMARGGKLNFTLDYVRLGDGTKVPLRATREAKGGGHIGAMAGAMVATAMFVPAAAPFFLLMHGKEAVIPQGTEITAYVNGDVNLQHASLQASLFK